MKNLFIVINSAGIGFDPLSGIASLVEGAFENQAGKGNVATGNQYYNTAESDIPDQYSNEMMSSRELINQKRMAYNNGTINSSVNAALGKNIATADQSEVASAGGNTGAVMKAIMGINSIAGDTLDKDDQANNATGNQLLGLENTEDDAIQKRADDVAARRQDFNDTRAAQYSTLGYGQEKAGQQSMAAGGASIINSIGSALI